MEFVENRRKIEELTCALQTYAWGKHGSQSLAGKLKKQADQSFNLDESTPFAELWMGTHPNGPAKISRTGAYLSDFLTKDVVGKVPDGYPDNDLPFMLKVLSIQTALSIQSHPDKVLGKILHEKFPHIYKDPNHKPEMAVSLTQFEGMCGFRQISEIKANIAHFPELKNVLGDEVSSQFLDDKVDDNSDEESKRNALKDLFRNFLECSDEITNAEINKLISRLSNLASDEGDASANPVPVNEDHAYVQQLILRLHVDYPDDRGVLCPLLLNCVRLGPGGAFFMGPNEPHAYISGDIVECMALSDNTVRAGLTPKFKDVETLCAMLHYRCGKPSSLLTPVALDDYTQLYRPPIAQCAEFEVERCTFPPNTTAVNSPPAVPCGSILLVRSGSVSVSVDDVSLNISEGSVVYVAADSVLTVVTGDVGAELFRAHINLNE